MSRDSIEERDQELVEQFRSLFGDRYRKQKARRRLLIKLLLAGSLCFVSVSIMMNRNPIPDVPMYKSEAVMINRNMSIAATVSDPADRLPAEQEKMQTDILIKKIEQLPPKKILLPAEKGTANNSIKQPLKFMPAAEVFAKTVPEIKKETISKELIVPDPIENTVKEIRPKLEKQDVADNYIRIAEIMTCLGVEERNAVSPQNVFSLQKDSKPHIWMDVRSKKLPGKLKHVYYCNGRRYCSVPLSIHYPRTRTWSNVTLRYAWETGDWRVDVLSKSGVMLAQVEFTVVQ